MKKNDFYKYNINDISDYVKDGELHENAPTNAIMVESESDLANLEGYYPGSVAYTAGFQAIWQLNSDGEWVSMI